jgi:hypothetical protein
VSISLGEPERIRMTINGTCRAALIVLASCAAAAAQTSRPQNGEFVMLDRPAVFEITPNTGSLKESVQKGQQLVWHPKEKPNEPRFQVTNM